MGNNQTSSPRTHESKRIRKSNSSYNQAQQPVESCMKKSASLGLNETFTSSSNPNDSTIVDNTDCIMCKRQVTSTSPTGCFRFNHATINSQVNAASISMNKSPVVMRHGSNRLLTTLRNQLHKRTSSNGTGMPRRSKSSLSLRNSFIGKLFHVKNQVPRSMTDYEIQDPAVMDYSVREAVIIEEDNPELDFDGPDNDYLSLRDDDDDDDDDDIKENGQTKEIRYERKKNQRDYESFNECIGCRYEKANPKRKFQPDQLLLNRLPIGNDYYYDDDDEEDDEEKEVNQNDDDYDDEFDDQVCHECVAESFSNTKKMFTKSPGLYNLNLYTITSSNDDGENDEDEDGTNEDDKQHYANNEYVNRNSFMSNPNENNINNLNENENSNSSPGNRKSNNTNASIRVSDLVRQKEAELNEDEYELAAMAVDQSRPSNKRFSSLPSTSQTVTSESMSISSSANCSKSSCDARRSLTISTDSSSSSPPSSSSSKTLSSYSGQRDSITDSYVESPSTNASLSSSSNKSSTSTPSMPDRSYTTNNKPFVSILDEEKLKRRLYKLTRLGKLSNPSCMTSNKKPKHVKLRSELKKALDHDDMESQINRLSLRNDTQEPMTPTPPSSSQIPLPPASSSSIDFMEEQETLSYIDDVKSIRSLDKSKPQDAQTPIFVAKNVDQLTNGIVESSRLLDQYPIRLVDEVNKKLLYYATTERSCAYDANGRRRSLFDDERNDNADCFQVETSKKPLRLHQDRLATHSNYYKDIDRIDISCLNRMTRRDGTMRVDINNNHRSCSNGKNYFNQADDDDTVSTYHELLIANRNRKAHSNSFFPFNMDAMSVCTKMSYLQQAPLASSENITLASSDENLSMERTGTDSLPLILSTATHKQRKEQHQRQQQQQRQLKQQQLQQQRQQRRRMNMTKSHSSYSSSFDTNNDQRRANVKTSSSFHDGVGNFLNRIGFKNHSHRNPSAY